MIRRFVLMALTVTLLSACIVPGFGLRRLHVGTLRTQEVDIPMPADTSREVALRLRFGAARFSLAGGAASLVQGTIRYNVDEFRPVITVSEGQVAIEQGEDLEAALPPSGTQNEWELLLSDAVPYSLHIQSGGYQGTWNLGGLRLRSLDIVEGATIAKYNFDRPNPEVMEQLRIKTGASRITLDKLVNANFREMTLDAGIGEYTLDFRGQLLHSANVGIRTGISRVTLSVPNTTPARIRVRGALRSVKVDGNWQRDGDDLITPGWDKATARLDISVEMGLGTLVVRSE